MFFSRSKVLCMDNRLSFLVVLPFLFEEFQKLIRIREGFTLLFASLRTFGICVIFLNHNDLIIVLRRQSIRSVYPILYTLIVSGGLILARLSRIGSISSKVV